jgi:hypothetical protein
LAPGLSKKNFLAKREMQIFTEPKNERFSKKDEETEQSRVSKDSF